MPFPSSPGPLFQNEGRCSAFDMEIIFHSQANKTHFHKKGCAPSLILKVRVFGTRTWPIKLKAVLSERVSSGPFTNSFNQLTFTVTATIKTLLQAGRSLFNLNISYNRVVISDWVYYKVQPSKRGGGGFSREGCNRKRDLIYFIMVNIVLGLHKLSLCQVKFARRVNAVLERMPVHWEY